MSRGGGSPRSRWLRRPESGAVGGVEALPFSVLVFVCGSLLVLNAWAVVDAKMATQASAREAARTFSEVLPSPTAGARARAAGRDAFAAHGHDPRRLRLDRPVGTGQRCGEVRVVARATVPAVHIPLVGGIGSRTVRGEHRERVDDLRSGLPGEAVCGG